MRPRSTTQSLVCIGAALFAVLWAIARACVQSITIDEAVTYMNFVRPVVAPTHWGAHANNHLLNSLLMRLFTSVFGTSPITVRSGALTGAVFYIAGTYWLSKLIARDFLLRLALFVCLVFNPLVFDFLVAARGYGLASAFLVCAIGAAACAMQQQNSGKSMAAALSITSVCISLSFLGNFSFAVVDALAVMMLLIWVCRTRPATQYVQLAAASILPGLLIAAVVAGSTVLAWHKDELNYGAETLGETIRSLKEASLYEPNPFFVPPLVLPLVHFVSRIILSVVMIAAAWRLVLILLHRGSLRDPHTRWLLGLATVPAGAISLSLAGHWLLSRFFQIPLPKDRTAIYVVVLGTLFIGILASVQIPTRVGTVSRRALLITLLVLASYFTLCLRLTFFKEWQWDADVKDVYAVLAYYNHTCGLKDIAVNWRYDASFNYYLAVSGRETITPFQNIGDYPPGRRAYVVHYPEDEHFITDHRLKVVYRAPSDAAVVIDFAADAPPGAQACELAPPVGIH